MSKTVGIIGFGRFGTALGGVLDECGVTYRAYDPSGRVPSPIAATTIADAVEGVELIVVAVPIPVMSDVIVALAPHVAPQQIVLDVASVKSAPSAAMKTTFGARIPWVATHPLFGPTSLALGERPLNVVVCPNPDHPAATSRVRSFWEALDCHVIEQDAESHDRGMAVTHALTYFVAKGLLDAGAGQGVAFAPPSFSAVARMIDMVRSDAGHLLGSIHRDNPFAADARRRLLDALGDIDGKLATPVADGDAPTVGASLSIPEPVETPPALRETRVLIDELDQDLIHLLSRRSHLSARAKKAKAGVGRAVRDPVREAEVLDARRVWGANDGIDGQSIDEIFDAILRFSRRVQGER